MSLKKKTLIIQLSNWHIKDRRLCGQVRNHPNFKDGSYVYPSRMVKFNPKTRMMLSFSGKLYRLEFINPDYAKMVPNVEALVLKRLSELPLFI